MSLKTVTWIACLLDMLWFKLAGKLPVEELGATLASPATLLTSL